MSVTGISWMEVTHPQCERCLRAAPSPAEPWACSHFSKADAAAAIVEREMLEVVEMVKTGQ